MNPDNIKPDDDSQPIPPEFPNMIADAISKGMTFTRTFRSSHDTNYISMIHAPENTGGISITIDAPPVYKIFYRNKLYIKQNGKYVDDTAFNNKPKIHLEETGLKAKVLDYDCDIFTSNQRKSTFYITKDLHQNINPLFRQFDNLSGAILYAKFYSEENKGYTIFTATSVK